MLFGRRGYRLVTRAHAWWPSKNPDDYRCKSQPWEESLGGSRSILATNLRRQSPTEPAGYRCSREATLWPLGVEGAPM